MKTFCEIIVSNVLPALRAIIADELSTSYNLSQVEISKKLGMTQPAISQYRRDLRGQRTKIITSNQKVMELVKRLAHDISVGEVGPKDLHKRFCAICKTIREEGLLCKLHESACPSLCACDICFG